MGSLSNPTAIGTLRNDFRQTDSRSARSFRRGARIPSPAVARYVAEYIERLGRFTAESSPRNELSQLVCALNTGSYFSRRSITDNTYSLVPAKVICSRKSALFVAACPLSHFSTFPRPAL